MTPISATRKALYPANWDQISRHVRAEALWRCEECEVADREVGYRWPDTGGEFRAVDAKHSVAVFQCLKDLRGPNATFTRIVLTVHHIDGDPTNNERNNLVALCQRCHLQADARLRKQRKEAKR